MRPEAADTSPERAPATGDMQGETQNHSRFQKRLLIPRTTIQERVATLARRITRDYAASDPIFIGVLNGAVFFFTDLIRALDIPVRIDFVRAASYGAAMESSGKVVFSKGVEIAIRNEPVVLVEDIVDTGLTLQRMMEHLRALGPASLKVCALIDKAERRQVPVFIDYCGFRIPEGFLVGYGLDFNERYRTLPDLYVLEQEEGGKG